MLSKIKIDIDSDNVPVIEVSATRSEDVRDKMVFRMLDSMHADNGFAWVTCIGSGPTSNWIIRTVDERQETDVLNAYEALGRRLQSISSNQVKTLSPNPISTPTDNINQIYGICIAIQCIRNLGWVNSCVTGDSIYWENSAGDGSANSKTTVSPTLNRRELEGLSTYDLAKKIISVFDNISKWQKVPKKI